MLPFERVLYFSVKPCDSIVKMVAQNTVRTYGVNQFFFQFVTGIRLHRQSRQNRICFLKIPILLHTCATCSELPSNIINICTGSSDPCLEVTY